MQSIVIHPTRAYPFWQRPLQLGAVSSGIDRTRTFRGAVCGTVAAALWGLQQPLDKLAFGCSYDDVELLGKAVTRGDHWYPVGLGLHLGNGAAFGALYANLAPSMPIAPAARGPVAALAEHLALWSLGEITDRFHPARDQLPKLSRNRAAFLQATWRHLLFGLVLGELERRFNADPDPVVPEPQADYSSNGHGSFRPVLSVQPAD